MNFPFIPFILLFIYGIFLIIFIQVYVRHTPSFQRKLVTSTTHKILDQILHFDPAISELAWNSSIANDFLCLTHKDADVIVPILFEETKLPLRVAFFALYFKLKHLDTDLFSRVILHDLVLGGGGICNGTISEIATWARCGLSEWINHVDDFHKPAFNRDLTSLYTLYLRKLLYSSG